MASLVKILYIKIRFCLKCFFAKSTSVYDSLRGKKKCLVMLAADYGNLGDVAITYAQEQWLAVQYPEYEIVDVPISKTLSHLKALKNICSSTDIITIVGGGNMSDLYFDIEILRQMVVKAFQNNRIISFPQTLFFSDTLGGKFLKWMAKRTYSKHKNLTITAREIWSFNTMKQISLDCLLLPDIVMTLDKSEPKVERSGITMCLRNDKEASLSKDFVHELRERLSLDFAVADYDTHIDKEGMSVAEREQELEMIWTSCRSSQWVLTDRLHGMIFAFITGTPCIVFPNNNYKIEGCYKWIKDCGYVFYLGECNIDDIIKRIGKPVTNKYNEISNIINSKFIQLQKNTSQ